MNKQTTYIKRLAELTQEIEFLERFIRAAKD